MPRSITQNITQHHWHTGEDRIIRHRDLDGADMSGFSLQWELFNPRTDVAVFTKTDGSGITVENAHAVNDRAVVTIDAADTVNLTPGTYKYEFSRTDAGNKLVMAVGSVTIVKGRL